jgi:hypothetical protein
MMKPISELNAGDKILIGSFSLSQIVELADVPENWAETYYQCARKLFTVSKKTSHSTQLCAQ